MAFCAYCGTKSHDAARFCTKCGVTLNPADPAADPVQPTDGAGATQQPPPTNTVTAHQGKTSYAPLQQVARWTAALLLAVGGVAAASRIVGGVGSFIHPQPSCYLGSSTEQIVLQAQGPAAQSFCKSFSDDTWTSTSPTDEPVVCSYTIDLPNFTIDGKSMGSDINGTKLTVRAKAANDLYGTVFCNLLGSYF